MNIYLNEAGAEILKALRAPEFVLPTLLMPMAFYTLFGVVLPGADNNAPYLLATYGVFAVMGPSIFGFGVGVANERDRGWLQLKRAAPAPAFAYISAKLITTLLFCAAALLPIYLIAGFLGEVALPRGTWTLLFVLHLFSAVPFVLIGLILGFSLNSGGAVAVSNIVFLGLAILGGLWFPVFMFPAPMQTLSAFTPSFHLAELALCVIGAPGERSPQLNLIWISVMTASLGSLAIASWARQR
ncbi:ABC transporter permease [Arenicella xantha]|uniref:ABC-2 type transport system permease protein n=1 Tax=Arenicella xantha TaxID=644221 RepID=A0A395JKN0_9GAMM|nr:ABC transporter permease [Arenicella xantha]RBP49612.1 ABC-2 type transport system permease protein [Arenicella xantha]